MYCDFSVDKKAGDTFCSLCHRRVRATSSRKIVRRCNVESEFAGTAGAHLHSILGVLGIHANSHCKCTARIAHMNRMGNDWCEQNIDTICEWLREEAAARNLPYLDIAGRTLVKLAIRRARKGEPNV